MEISIEYSHQNKVNRQSPDTLIELKTIINSYPKNIISISICELDDSEVGTCAPELEKIFQLFRGTSVKKLNFTNNPLDKKLFKILYELLTANQLTELVLCDAITDEEIFSDICLAATNCRSLKSLDLQGFELISDNTTQILCNMIERNQSITELLISNLRLEPKQIKPLIVTLQKNYTITDFYLWDTLCTEEEIKTQDDIVKRNVSLAKKMMNSITPSMSNQVTLPISKPDNPLVHVTNHIPQTTITIPNNISVISMAPINSSGDIYHMISYLICALQNKFPKPQLLLSYDIENNNLEGSKTCTQDQVERAINFVDALGYKQYFRNPFLARYLNAVLPHENLVNSIGEYLGLLEFHSLKLPAGNASRQNARQTELDSYFQSISNREHITIEYFDQKATTVAIAKSLELGQTSNVLKDGYNKLNPHEISVTAQKLISEYANYWIGEIRKTTPENQPLIILHVRHSAFANKAQEIPGSFLLKLKRYLEQTGHQVWYIFTDSRLKGSFIGINNHRISPFQRPLKKDKAHYKNVTKILDALDVAKREYDFGKLLHLQLLLKLLEFPSLKGIIGNTSGTLDLAAFIGHHVYNMHIFKPTIAYQDYRLLTQMFFMSIEHYLDNQDSVQSSLKTLPNWLKEPKTHRTVPSIQFTPPTLQKSGFSQLFYYTTFTQGTCTIGEIPFNTSVSEKVNAKFKK